jgi:lipid-A-disaccharide synthase
LLAAQLGAARELERRLPGRFQFVLCKAKNLKQPFFDAHVKAGGGAAGIPDLKVVEENHALLSASDLALAASGTLTLEATLYRTPMLVMYRGPWYLYQLSRVLMTTEHIALPNNLAKRRIVPELWQYEVNPTTIADSALAVLEPAAYATMERELDAVANQFADTDTPRRVAQAIAELAACEDASDGGRAMRGQTPSPRGA